MASETKSRKPANTAFKQQRLKAWQPILAPNTVLPTLFIVGIIFAPLGGLLLWASNNVSEISFEYTFCDSTAPVYPIFEPMPSKYIQTSFPGANSGSVGSTQWSRQVVVPLQSNPQKIPYWGCRIRFGIPNQLEPPVFFYYYLTNFYQNHRRYVKSFDSDQLKGVAVSPSTLQKSDCKPMAVTPDGLPIYPCGLIANSQFNDTISNLSLLSESNFDVVEESYNFNQSGIAWPSDRQKYGKTTYEYSKIRPPPNWVDRYPNGTYTDEYPPPDLSNDEPFQVWMRTAGLPNFRKLYGKNEIEPLKAGTYEVLIEYKFPVTRYGGTKSFVISTVSFLGGKNPFLGYAYIGVGILCILLGCVFTVKHLYKPRKLGDHTYLSWNN
ncbi:6851_t:CDS:2 [Entrophospora sp. SA101]|nr:8442_t:CDS:2 [Entrophospora sp. SA101]CAJ0911617.1 6851_t:CDS:2 [Entrophospora sp. SA101]